MNARENTGTSAAALTAVLTPTQIRGLKLAKDGDLHFQGANKWTHDGATITFAKSDRFKERPLKIKSITTATVNELRNHGLLRIIETEDAAGTEEASAPHEITMAGKIWLLKNK